MSPRYPFDDDEDSGTIDSFQVLHDDPAFPEGIDFETDGFDSTEDGIPLLDDVVSPAEGRAPRSEAVEALAAAVREKLEAELDQVVAGVIAEALRPAILDLEANLRAELYEALRRRLAELIDEHMQRSGPPPFAGDF